ncbi:MAG: ParB/RepB/Spo0J family partition protein [Acidobacteria bacterium]|nr:MAG: ParB/RepB/Spo0J family partition protein [Acidobacteriota bacterium]MCL4287021.1 ParB/RepB/Spo0J family partition protein [Thermoleophilia bacterium]GIK78481.1 MAG: chromosome partitioning protein ParB [Actinomycetes bacterium]
MARKAGMGRGLAAILPESHEVAEPTYRDVPIELIRPSAGQPRKSFDGEALARLADSIVETGVVQPLVVQPLSDGRYELIAGERRWRAAQRAGLATVPAVLRSEDEMQRLQIALIENMAREDLNPIEEARACAELVEGLELSKEEVARRLGRSRSAISNLIRLLDLPDQVIALLESGALSEGHGRALLAARGQDERRALARRAVDEGWSVRETEQRARGERPARPGRRTRTLHPDEEAAIGEAEDALERALGRGVRVSSGARGVTARIRFDDFDELLELTRSLRRE